MKIQDALNTEYVVLCASDKLLLVGCLKDVRSTGIEFVLDASNNPVTRIRRHCAFEGVKRHDWGRISNFVC